MENTHKEATIQEIVDIVKDIKVGSLIVNTSNLIYNYENNRLDNEDFYRITSDIMHLLCDIQVLRDEVELLA